MLWKRDILYNPRMGLLYKYLSEVVKRSEPKAPQSGRKRRIKILKKD